jgi:hypothetical protein
MSEDEHRVGRLEEAMHRRWGGALHDSLDDPHDIRDPLSQRWLAGREWRGNERALAEVKQTMQDDMQRMTAEFRHVTFQIRQTTQWYVEERHAEAVLPTLAEHEAYESSVYHDVEEHAHRDAEEPFPEIWPPLSLEETMGPTPERERDARIAEQITHLQQYGQRQTRYDGEDDVRIPREIAPVSSVGQSLSRAEAMRERAERREGSATATPSWVEQWRQRWHINAGQRAGQVRSSGPDRQPQEPEYGQGYGR